jgi:hypothetical protein
VFEYDSTGSRCSITGGHIYRGAQGNLPLGGYVYGDYCTGEILVWNNNQQQVLLDTGNSQLVGFGEDEQGESYRVGHNGTVEKIVRARASADFDGDARSDVSIFRPSNGWWYIINSSNGGVRTQQFGIEPGTSGDIPTPEDIDGDNITDIGYYRPGDGQANARWFFFRSSDSTVPVYYWGTLGDLPAAGDYDGDARADVAVFRPSEGRWYILQSGGGPRYETFGQAGDRPVSGDYDADGRYDIALFRDSNGTWYRRNSSNGASVAIQWGLNGDVPAQGDFDADGRIDHAVYRPSNGTWYILFATGSFQGLQWGVAEDIPAVGDYDGDGRDDVAVFRPSNGTWYIIRSTGGFLGLQWGVSGDIPVPTTDDP